MKTIKYLIFLLLFLALVFGPISFNAYAVTKKNTQELTDLKVSVGAYEDGLYKIAAKYFYRFS